MDKTKNKFTKKYDWMYRRMLANLSVSDISRKTFKKWWKALGDMVDSAIKMPK